MPGPVVEAHQIDMLRFRTFSVFVPRAIQIVPFVVTAHSRQCQISSICSSPNDVILPSPCF